MTATKFLWWKLHVLVQGRSFGSSGVTVPSSQQYSYSGLYVVYNVPPHCHLWMPGYIPWWNKTVSDEVILLPISNNTALTSIFQCPLCTILNQDAKTFTMNATMTNAMRRRWKYQCRYIPIHFRSPRLYYRREGQRQRIWQTIGALPQTNETRQIWQWGTVWEGGDNIGIKTCQSAFFPRRVYCRR